MDFGKYKYAQSKQMHAARMKQKNVQVKEIKFRPGTDDGDYNIKLRKIIAFLTVGDKVKVTLRFRGREITFQQLGLALLKRVEADLMDYAVVEQFPKMEGRQMVMVLQPHKNPKAKDKIKSDQNINLELIKNIDILKTISENYDIFTIGFAAETNELKNNALKKLRDKKISVVAANKVSFEEGIDNNNNSITLFWGDGLEKTLDLKNKKELAVEFVEEISNICS